MYTSVSIVTAEFCSVELYSIQLFLVKVKYLHENIWMEQTQKR